MSVAAVLDPAATVRRSTAGAIVDATQGGGVLTCISCRLTFGTVDEQKTHYRGDLHRFNLKRKVALLPPVTAEVFAQKLESVKATAEAENAPVRGAECVCCRKFYASPNALTEHLRSKKHREREAAYNAQKAAAAAEAAAEPASASAAAAAAAAAVTAPAPAPAPALAAEAPAPAPASAPTAAPEEAKAEAAPTTTTTAATVSDDVDDEMETMIAERIAKAVRLTPNDCLFCRHRSGDVERSLKHMADEHSFFIPDLDFVINLPGLLEYLGEKVSVGLTCLWCNGKGRSFHTLSGVQTHMRDLGHTKMLFDGNEEEYGDFFDFSSTWDGVEDADDIDEWEKRYKRRVELSDNGFELKINGKIIGHRSLAHYYRQRLPSEEKRPAVLAALANVMSHYRALGWEGHTDDKVSSELQSSVLAVRADANMRLGISHNRFTRRGKTKICHTAHR